MAKNKAKNKKSSVKIKKAKAVMKPGAKKPELKSTNKSKSAKHKSAKSVKSSKPSKSSNNKSSKSVVEKKIGQPMRSKAARGQAKKSTRSAHVMSSKISPKRSSPPQRIVNVKSLQEFFVPLDDRLLVRVLVNEETTSGGLYVPDAYREKQSRGLVVSAGRGHRTKRGLLIPTEVKVGDYVLFAQFSGQTIHVDGEELLVIREQELLGIVGN